MSSQSDVHAARPRRFIYNDDDMDHFLKSQCKRELLQFTSAMGKSCSSKEFDYDPAHPLVGLSPAMAALHGAVAQMQTWRADFPPFENAKARFGNPAFKEWYSRLLERTASIVYCVLKVNKQHSHQHHDDFDANILEKCSDEGFAAAASPLDLESVSDIDEREVVLELAAYLNLAFGHPIRLDYGTGHESSFQVFLFSLCKLGCFDSTPSRPSSVKRLKATTLSLYSAYLFVCRQIQTDYMLEPAGSHGVWGLDDYHCLPFYFGACQLLAVDHDLELTPRSIHDADVLRNHADQYLYFGCIRYIKTLKKGAPFFESSPMLNDISSLPNWSKVASGLLLLYEGEVLDKRQVVQHFVFGKIFMANWTPSLEEDTEAPKENFRAPGEATMAPWVDSQRLSGNGGLPGSTQAPWANQSSPSNNNGFAPTKAPWTK